MATAPRDYRTPLVPRSVTVVEQQNLAAGDQQIAFIDGKADVRPAQNTNGDSEEGSKPTEGSPMSKQQRSLANPRRVEAGRRNWSLRGPLTPQGRERLRQAALANRPWEKSTGPRTLEGKARSAANGRKRQKEKTSIRELAPELATIQQWIDELAACRTLMVENQPPATD